MPWNIVQAKQQFSELVRRSARQPQLIYNRKNMVAAVIDAQQYLAFKKWADQAPGQTLADEFAELRGIMQDEDYQLAPSPRSSRRDSLTKLLEEESHELTLVTRNTRDFEFCGIELLNPFSDNA